MNPEQLTHEDVRKFYNEKYYKNIHANVPIEPHVLLEAKEVCSILKVEKNKKLLDVACGPGTLLMVAQSKGLQVAGLDISDSSVAVAKVRVPGGDVRVGVGENLPWPDASFDYVTCCGSMEHFLDFEKGSREILRVLKPNGTVLISLPNMNYYQHVWKRLRKRSVYQHQIYERDDTSQGWLKRLTANGFKIVKIKKFNKFTHDAFMRWVRSLVIPRAYCHHVCFVCKKG